MQDGTLLKLSLATSLIGIILLFAFAQTIESERVTIADVDKSFIGRNIELFANIESFYSSNGNYFLKVSDKTGNITAVLFKQTAANSDMGKLKKGQQIILSGKISEYKSSLEIIADKIEYV
ncbi:MAG: OB-fold nucleic acid binding domain-containing protein [Nanoarchaeota archaeon]|nr:OB-fold nucleic acid binding domain-containing protein [Nanoarchaeota archaeon]